MTVKFIHLRHKSSIYHNTPEKISSAVLASWCLHNFSKSGITIVMTNFYRIESGSHIRKREMNRLNMYTHISTQHFL